MSKTIYTEIVNPNNNLLFTSDQLNQAKIDDKCLPVKCLQCGKTFYITRRQYCNFLEGYSSLKFCGKQCQRNALPSRITKPCLNCGKLVTKVAGEAKKYPNFFCCQSCAASYNNKKDHQEVNRVEKKLVNLFAKRD